MDPGCEDAIREAKKSQTQLQNLAVKARNEAFSVAFRGAQARPSA